MIKVLLVDDHQIVLDGLSLLLEKEKDILKVGEAQNGIMAIEIVDKEEVDVVVIDIEMPKMNGVEATEILKEKFPNIKVLVLTMYEGEDFISNLIALGADGYILKNRGKEELVRAIRSVNNGEKYLGKVVTEKLFETLQKNQKTRPAKETKKISLTKREKEVLKLIVEGLTTPKISDTLFIAHSTVETHRRNLIDKTGVSNTKALIRFAFENNLLVK